MLFADCVRYACMQGAAAGAAQGCLYSASCALSSTVRALASAISLLHCAAHGCKCLHPVHCANVLTATCAVADYRRLVRVSMYAGCHC
jgi:CBS-domain-containing membrane protein